MLGRTQNIRHLNTTVWLHCQKYGVLISASENWFSKTSLVGSMNFVLFFFFFVIIIVIQILIQVQSWLCWDATTQGTYFWYMSPIFVFSSNNNYSWLTKKFNHTLVYSRMIVYWQIDKLWNVSFNAKGEAMCLWQTSALHLRSVYHLNIDGPPFSVKCLRKSGSALGGEVTYRCVCVCMRALTRHAKSEHYACSVHAKSRLSTKTEHNGCLLLVLVSFSNSSSLKTQELAPKLYG